jgi:hypothetical protein
LNKLAAYCGNYQPISTISPYTCTHQRWATRWNHAVDATKTASKCIVVAQWIDGWNLWCEFFRSTQRGYDTTRLIALSLLQNSVRQNWTRCSCWSGRIECSAGVFRFISTQPSIYY